MQITTAFGLIFTIALLTSGRVEASGCCDTGGTDWDTLFNGAVLITPLEKEKNLHGVRAQFTVAAPQDSVWNTLTDYDHYTQIFDGIKNIEVLEKDAGGATVEFWIDAVLKDFHYVLRRRYDPARGKISWDRMSGDLQKIEGSWRICASPRKDTVLLVYESYVKVGGFVPEALVRRGTQQRARAMALRLRSWVERGKKNAALRG